MKYLFLLFLPFTAIGQDNFIQNHTDLHRFANRMEIRGVSEQHSSLNMYSSRILFDETVNIYDSLKGVDQYLAAKFIRSYPEFWDRIQSDGTIQKEYIDSSQTFYTEKTEKGSLSDVIEPSKPVLKYFYGNRNVFATVKSKGFLLKVNPILYFGLGRDLANDATTFENRRGISLSGHIDDFVYFYSDIIESQAIFPSYINDFVNKFQAVPGNGFYKIYRSSVIKSFQGYDFLNATAYLNGKISKNINVEFGNGRNFLGNGNRSLLMSDFTNNALYLKFNTRIWKIHYQNLFNELIPISPNQNPSGTVIPRKYSATHYLSFKHKGFEIGLFESIVFERDGKFDLQYLNPVILYRLVEYNLDSSDNVLVGVNGKMNLMKRFQFYGQLLLDEFKLDELFFQEEGEKGWWANKYGIQVGVKYIDAFGIENLDFNLEYNRVRPFTYGHRSMANFSHANQAIAHPLGANFEEWNFNFSYYITPKLQLNSQNYFINQGLDSDSTYYGANILISSAERSMQYGHFLLQGVSSSTLLSVNRISYELMPNYFLDVNLTYRSQNATIPDLTYKNLILSGGLRVNFWEPKIHI